MTELKRAVFLSYAKEDAEAARHIADAFRSAGIEMWFDQNELRGGDAWDRHIRKQIHDCFLFIAVISSNTDARSEGYFRREWRLAVDRSHDMAEDTAFLIPVVIDNTHEASARVPDQFRHLQWTRLPNGDTPPAFIEQVLRLLSQNQHVQPTSTRPPTGPSSGNASAPLRAPSLPSSASSRLRPAVLLIAAVGVIVAGYVAFDRFVLSKRVGTQTTTFAARSAATTTGATSEKSIAVLPFVDMSEKHDQEYFGDGMAEEILDLLVKIPKLKVIGRTSSFQFKGKTDDLRTIGTALGATYVVEGSVRRSGDHVRVTAQLIDTRDGAHRWSEKYDRNVSDVLKVQGEIATSLVRALQLEMTALSQLQAQSVGYSDSYDMYLRGLHASNWFNERGFEEAIADFRRALELDPSFVAAAEALAMNLASQADWGFVPAKQGWEQARAAAERALKLDPKSARAHAVLGDVRTLYDLDWPGAARELETAVALAPNDPMVLSYAATERLAVGQWAESTHILDTATAADPLDPGIHEVRCWLYLRMGRLEEAENAARRLLEIAPTYAWGHYDLGLALLVKGQPEAALAEMEKETADEGREAGLALAYQALHRTKEADAALVRLETEHASDAAMDVARSYAFRGQKDVAFKWLDRAYAQKDTQLFVIKGDPLLKNLEGDPRHQAFLRKLNLAE